MKQKRVFLDDLDNTSRAYKVRVKVVEKGRPQKSPTKGTVYQSLVIEDDKGNRMRGALFGDQVDCYKEAFVYNGTYDIANAPVRRCDPQWKRDKDDLDYQMTFGNDTVIQALEQPNKETPADYKPVSEIPKSTADDEKYDVLGLVVFVEAEARTFKKQDVRQTFVRDILIMDDCTQQPVTISAWNDLATTECDSLVDLVATPKVVAFTALRVSSYKGFSLTTTMSTNLVHAPAGNAATKLQNWAYQNRDVLRNMHSRIISVKQVEAVTSTQLISTLLRKKLNCTLQDERHWLEVTIDEPELKNIYAYVGCAKCGKRTDTPLGELYYCSSCSNHESVASPRITFNCNVSDKTGTLPITAFATHAELLLANEAKELFRIKQMNDKEAFERIIHETGQKSHLIQVGPKASMARNNVLQWVLKAVEVNKPTQAKGKLPAADPIETTAAATGSGLQLSDKAISNTEVETLSHQTEQTTNQINRPATDKTLPSINNDSATVIPPETINVQRHSHNPTPINESQEADKPQAIQQQTKLKQTQRTTDQIKASMPKLQQVKLEKGTQNEQKGNSVTKSDH